MSQTYTPEYLAPERRWEYLCINGQQNILAALAAGYELAAPPYVGFCTTNGHTTSWVEAFVRTPLILAEPAVPAAAPDGEPSQSVIAQQMTLIANVIYERFPKDARDLRELAAEVGNLVPAVAPEVSR